MKKKITWMLAASMDLSGGRLVQRCPDRQTYLSHTQAPAASEERQQVQSVLLLCCGQVGWALYKSLDLLLRTTALNAIHQNHTGHPEDGLP